MELGDCIEGLRFGENGGMVFLRALEGSEKIIQGNIYEQFERYVKKLVSMCSSLLRVSVCEIRGC
jgi:hypothetical protein